MRYDTVTVRWAEGEQLVGTPAAENNREGFIEDSSLSTVGQAIAYGEKWLAQHAEQVTQVDVGIQPTRDEIRPWTGVGKGDALRVLNKAGTAIETARVYGIGFTGLRRNGEPNWSYTVGSASQERVVVASRELGRITRGSMRGSFGAATPNTAPSWGKIESGKLPKNYLEVADTDEFRLDEPYDRTKPDPIEEALAVVRIECMCESLVGSDDSEIEIWRVAYSADGTEIAAESIDSFVWPGTVYRYTHITELQFAQAQGYQIRNVLAAGATVREDEVFEGSQAAGAHRLITIKALASTAN